jgi:hypothetical protein
MEVLRLVIGSIFFLQKKRVVVRRRRVVVVVLYSHITLVKVISRAMAMAINSNPNQSSIFQDM